MTKWCNTCDHKAYCRGGNDTYTMGCSRYIKAKPKPMTNEEWLKSLDTEQLAKFIFWQHFDVYGKTLYELMVNASRGVSRDKQAEVMIGAVVEWLKQPHKDGE